MILLKTFKNYGCQINIRFEVKQFIRFEYNNFYWITSKPITIWIR